MSEYVVGLATFGGRSSDSPSLSVSESDPEPGDDSPLGSEGESDPEPGDDSALGSEGEVEGDEDSP